MTAEPQVVPCRVHEQAARVPEATGGAPMAEQIDCLRIESEATSASRSQALPLRQRNVQAHGGQADRRHGSNGRPILRPMTFGTTTPSGRFVESVEVVIGVVSSSSSSTSW